MKVIIGIEMQIFKDNGGVSNYSIFFRMEFVNEQRLGPHFSGHFTKRKQLAAAARKQKLLGWKKCTFREEHIKNLLAPFALLI